MDQKILRTGHSLAVSIPSDFARRLGLTAGGQVRVKADLQSATLTLHFSTGQMNLLAGRRSTTSA